MKLIFRLVDLENLAAAPGKSGLVIPLTRLPGAGRRLSNLRLVVRQVNEQTVQPGPTEAGGIGELDLTFKTV